MKPETQNRKAPTQTTVVPEPQARNLSFGNLRLILGDVALNHLLVQPEALIEVRRGAQHAHLHHSYLQFGGLGLGFGILNTMLSIVKAF